jgi:pseudouridine-5'-phosphate glycosidase
MPNLAMKLNVSKTLHEPGLTTTSLDWVGHQCRAFPAFYGRCDNLRNPLILNQLQ